MKLLFVMACLITLVFVLWQAANVRGRIAWNNYRKAAIKSGEPMDMKSIIPPPVPDASNFASIPFFAPLFNFVPGTQKFADTNAFTKVSGYFDELSSVESKVERTGQNYSNTWVTAKKPLALIAFEIKASKGETNALDPGTMTEKESATTILAYLKKYDEALGQIEEAALRPKSRFPISYEHTPSIGVLLPHLAVLKRVSTAFQLRACANIQAGNNQAAEHDVHTILRAAQGPKDEPILISHLVRLAMLHAALQPIAEGIAAGAWSDQQLAGFQEDLFAINVLPDLKKTLRGESIFFGINTIDALRRGEISDNLSDLDGRALRFVPDGWFYGEMLNYHKALAAYANAFPTDKPLDPAAIESLTERYGTTNQNIFMLYWNNNFFVRMLVPALSRTLERTARAQTGLRLGGLACALERHRLQHGNYPESLEELKSVPAAMTHDLVLGGPLHYRREAEHGYVLYSLGWNRKDDGGVPTTEGKKSKQTDLDWVWRPLPRGAQ